MRNTILAVCAATALMAVFYWFAIREPPDVIEARRVAGLIWSSPKGLAVRTECARKYGIDEPHPDTIDVLKKHHDWKETIDWARCSLRGLYPESYLLTDPDPND